jgi:multidrug efflux pump subunit AcrB
MFFPLVLLERAMRPVNRFVTRILNWFVTRIYLPLLRRSVAHPSVVVAIAIAILVVSAGFMRSGRTPFQIMPKMDSYLVRAVIRFPDGTPAEFTDRATQQIEAAIGKVHEKYAAQGMPLLKVSHRTVGYIAMMEMAGPQGVVSDSHIGGVNVELVDTSQRTIHSEEILAEWRQAAGDFPGAESVTFGTPTFGPGGTPIEFKLVSDPEHFAEVEEAVEVCKEKLASYKGVFDVEDDSQPGKWEFQLTVKDKAKAMGVPLAALAETVRSAYYGDEVMRLQRGRHEVKLMVRYPREDRHSLGTFDEIRVKTPDGAQRPITELADVKVERGYSEFNRIDQKRAITVSADVEDGVANARDIVNDLQGEFVADLSERFPHVAVRWEGQQEQTNESVDSMLVGFAVAVLAMFMLLTIEFRSYIQPLLILMIIPFGAIGAVLGHFLMGLNISLFTLFGLVALAGVVVNDSIVLIDFINRRIRGGMPLKKALVEAGRRRFRAVLLTSATTIAGLLPILTERSFQAQILIPMANVLVFGLMMTTVLVLFLVPAFYYIVARISGIDPDEPIREEYEPDDALDDVDVPVDELAREAPVSDTPAAEPIAS